MLSNKLTFSLSFMVMLVLGLALMATTADAAKYKATWDSTGDGEWDISIYIPVDDDNPLEDTSGTAPATPAITRAQDEDDNIAGVDLKNAEGMAIASSSSSITANPVQSDLTMDATDRADVFAHRYDFSVTPPADPAGLADLQDDTAITMTLGDYTPVVIGLMHRTSGIETTAFVETELGVNTFEVTITMATSPFAVLVASEEPMEDNDSVLMNGIRTGTNFIPDGVVQEAEGNLPNLDSFFRNGGTIKLLDSGDNGDDTVVTGEAFITEIMWGVDGGNLTGPPTMDSQWIEVYYQGDAEEVTLYVQFIFGAHDSTALDAVGNLYLAKWNPPGQSGHSQYGQFNGEPPVPIVSMYRKRNLVAGGGLAYDPNAKFAETDAQFGYVAAAWAESQATINMSGAFVGSPGSTHVPARVGETIGEAVPVQVTAITATPLRFSEARNGPDRDGNVNWLEIENVSDDPVPLKDYEISVVSGVSRNDLHGAEHKDYKKLLARTKEVAALTTHQTGNEHDKAIIGNDDYNADGQNDVKQFPDWMLPAKAFLLIVNRDPEDTILAGGKDIEILANANIDDNTTNKGAGFYYFVTPDLDRAFETRVVSYVGIIPATTHSGAPMLVLRSKTDKNETDETIVDVAGSGRFDDQLDRYKYNFNTEIWPLRGTHNIDRGGPNLSADGGVWDLTEGDPHEWWKSKAVNSHGVGYDRGVDLNSSPGTPGYANDSVKDKTTDYKGTSDTTDDVVLLNGNISFSEIMFDASVHAGNERWNLVQWIELYNSSMMEAINLNGWELEIRNSDDHVDSFVDSSFIFGDAIIQPNQTLLLVSARAANDGINDNRVYNLYTQHARELGLANRRANLLSPAGFYLRLSYTANDGSNTKVVVDDAGNVSVAGRQRSTAEWEAMPPPEGPARHSLIRQYGTREEDGNGPDDKADGTMEDGWLVADLDGGGATFYGHRDDIATPGFRQGGPLPVSLASFRPVRNDAGAVIIKWITASELNNAGFNILRSQQRNGEFKVINPKMIAGAGTTSERNIYTFTDTTANPNVVYYYQIEDVSFDGRHQTLTTQRLKGHVSAGGKLTTTWSDLKRVK